ncbi:MAG: hypothetical protein GQ564_15235 [Bacteroidales bacterium]|nr:hypothetical protein [Bacteroidales bacterium]
MKDLKNLEGAKMLSKNEQIEIKGGIPVLCPCEAGGIISNNPDVWCDILFEGVCWICN